MRSTYGIPFHKEYFLFLLPVFFVLHGFCESFPLIKESDCAVLLLQYTLASIALCLFFFLIFKSWRKSTVFVFLLQFFYFFFGVLHDTAKSFLPQSFLVQYTFIVPLIIVSFIGLGFYFLKTKRQFNRFTQYVNVLFGILLILEVFQLTQKALRLPKQTNTLPIGFVNCDSCSKPDVFFIIADEYAGHQELKDIFHFDNSSFENALKQRGFHIIDSTISNYNYTPFSTASILSMNFLKGIEGINTSKTDRQLCYLTINRNDLLSFFKSQGYEFNNLSVFELNDVLPRVSSQFILAGKDLLTSQTFVSRLNRDIRFNLVIKYKNQSELKRLANNHLNNLEYLFNETKNEAAKEASNPRFIYTHLMMPHYPYILDKNGNKTDPEMVLEGNQVNQKAYIDYLQYSNSKFLQLIDALLKNVKTPPIIIFMGDHGFRHFSSDIDHKYHFMNLCSVYLPGRQYEQFYNGMSAVNMFRVVLNTSFNQHLPLQKDSTIYIR